MNTMKSSALLCLLACVAARTFAADPVAAPADPPIRKLDGHLVDLKGRGLYTWDGDKTPGVSACLAQCRLLWPPIKADDGAVPKGPFTIATRPDGTRQWALRGRPLYRWASDSKYGDAGGDQVAGMWHLVKVAPPKPAAGAAGAKPDAAAKPAAGAAPDPSAKSAAKSPDGG